MDEKPSILPSVHFGEAGRKPLDWRKRQTIHDLIDNDAELAKTPQHVIDMLGFDPLEPDE